MTMMRTTKTNVPCEEKMISIGRKWGWVAIAIYYSLWKSGISPWCTLPYTPSFYPFRLYLPSSEGESLPTFFFFFTYIFFESLLLTHKFSPAPKASLKGLELANRLIHQVQLFVGKATLSEQHMEDFNSDLSIVYSY